MLAYFAQTAHFCVHKQTDKERSRQTEQSCTLPLVRMCARMASQT